MSNAGRRASTPYRKPPQSPTGGPPSGESPYTKIPVAEGYGDLRIPAGFEGGVRRVDETGMGVRSAAQPDAIREGAASKSGRLLASINRYNSKLKELTDSGIAREAAIRQSETELDDIKELIIQTTRGDDGEKPVVADMAMALMSLGVPERQMVLRRAGNPEIFSTLENAVLEDAPAEGIGSESQRKSLIAAVQKEDQQLRQSFQRDKLPPSARPSNFFQQHGVLTSTGNPIDPSDIYKKRLPEDFDPMEVDAVADDAALTSTQSKALQQLAGDQIGEIKQIKRRQLVESKLYTDAEVKAFTAAELDAAYEALDKQNAVAGIGLPKPFKLTSKEEDIQRLVEAGVVGESGPISRQQADKLSAKDRLQLLESYGLIGEQPRQSKADTMYKGSSLGAGGTSDRSAKWNGSTADLEVSKRNKSGLERRVELLYRLTEDTPDVDQETGKVRTDHRGKPIQSQRTPQVIDLDKYFPWWRARIADVRPDGTLHFPKKQKTAEWVTMQMQGWLNVHDPDFFRRMLPLVQRSIAAMPTRAVKTAVEGGEVLGGGKAIKSISAADWEKEVYVPSAAMQEAMRGGPGTKTYPYSVYSDVDIDIDDVEAGTGTPQPIYEVEQSPTYQKMQEQMRQRQAQPGKTDSASMNSMPQYSLLRSLIA